MSYLQELLYNEKCFYQVTLGLLSVVFSNLAYYGVEQNCVGI